MAKATKSKKSKNEDVDDEPVKKKGGKGKGRTVIADFTKVEDGGGGRLRLKEGDYPAKLVKIEQKDSQAGNPMLVIDFEFTEGKKAKGKKVRDRITLTEGAIWRFRNLLQALGKEVPKKKLKINIDDLIGEELILTLEDDEYEGKISSKVSDYLSTDDVDDEADDDDEEDDDDDEDLDEVDLDEI